MPILDFEIAEYEARRAKVRTAMAEHGIDLALLTEPGSICYLTGNKTKAFLGFQCLVMPADGGALTLICKSTEHLEIAENALVDEIRGFGGLAPPDALGVLAEVLGEKRAARLRVGLEVAAYNLRPHHYLQIRDMIGPGLVEATGLVGDIRAIKSPAEIAFMRRSAAISDEAVRQAIEIMAPGVSENAVSAEVYRAVIALGSDVPPSAFNFAAGEQSCYPHGQPGDRVLRSGDFINIEFGASVNRYCTTIGRQFSLGQPTSLMRRYYDASCTACDAALAAMKPGIPAAEIDGIVVREMERRGVGGMRVHYSGFSIGLAFPPSWMEAVHLTATDPHILQPGMVLTVEPPVFSYEDRLGARVIENVLITEQGGEVLSGIPRDLIIL